jgi:hypothetical protein
VEVPPTSSRPQTHWIEFHHRSGWDRAIPASRVAVHQSRPNDGRSFALQVNGSQSLSDPHDEAFTTPDGSIAVRLVRLNATSADARVWELGPTKAHEIRILQLSWNPPGDDALNERVVLRSDRLRTTSLQGWSLRDEKAHSHSQPWRYVFPDVELAPGEDLTIWTRSGTDDTHNPFWAINRAVWNNSGGDAAVVEDATGVEIARFSY